MEKNTKEYKCHNKILKAVAELRKLEHTTVHSTIVVSMFEILLMADEDESLKEFFDHLMKFCGDKAHKEMSLANGVNDKNISNN